MIEISSKPFLSAKEMKHKSQLIFFVITTPLLFLKVVFSNTLQERKLTHTPIVTERLSEYSFFHTPSKNIWCSYNRVSGDLTCDVASHNWGNWKCEDAGCYGTRFVLPSNGSAFPQRSSDSLVGSSGNALNYGKRISYGLILCESTIQGLTCTNKSGNRMHLNREFFKLK